MNTSIKEKILLGAIALVSLLIVVVLAIGFSVIKQQTESIEQIVDTTETQEVPVSIESDSPEKLSAEQKQEILKSFSEESGGLTPGEMNEQLQKIEEERESQPRLTDEEKRRILEQL